MKGYKLQDCCLSISDGDHLPPPKSISGVPFITISNIDSANRIDFDNTMFVPNEYYERLDSTRKAQKGDVLYSVVGSFGKPVLIKEDKPFAFQRHIAILHPNKAVIDERFLYYTMLSRDFFMQADSVAIGAAQRTITLTALRNMEITLPTLPTQHRIADILSRYDALIDNYRQQIRLLEEAAQRLYKHWFVDLQFPGHENTRVVDGVPEGWERKNLDEIYCLKYGNNLSTKLIKEKGVYPVYGASKMIGFYDQCNCNEQVVLITSRGDAGYIHMTLYDKSFVTNNSFIVKPFSDFAFCKMPFTYHFLQSLNLKGLRSGSAQPQLTNMMLHNVIVHLPSQNIIEEFCKRTLGIYVVIKKHHINIINLSEARDRLLPKLMSGEIAV